MRSLSSLVLGLTLLCGPALAEAETEPEGNNPDKPDKGAELKFYGFAMTDAGYNFGTIDPNWFDVMRPTKLPAFRGEFGDGGRTYWGVRQSRFGVQAGMPTSAGDIKTIFEFEMFGVGVDAGQTTFRLRHFWGQLGEFGAGQTWSSFMDIDVFPNSIEYWGPNSMPFFRNVQVRWLKENGPSHFAISLERPGASADQASFEPRIELSEVASRFPLPDLTANGRYGGDWGYLQLSGILRYMRWDDLPGHTLNLAGDAIGWGFSLSSNISLGKKNVLKLLGMYGHGIESYINDGGDDIGPSINNATALTPVKGVALPIWGFLAFIDWYWNEMFTSSVGYSMVQVSNSSGQVPEAFHMGGYALANVLIHPTEHFMLGPEVQWGRRTNKDNGYSYNDYKLQFSLKYDFELTVSQK